MSFLEIYAAGGLVILAAMTILWLISLLVKDASIVDIFWGIGFVITGWVYFALTPDGAPGRKWLIGVLVTIWGLRLAGYIAWRNLPKGEDFRYRQWREQYGARWWWLSYFRVFLLQGVIMWVVSAPLLAAQISPTPDLGLPDLLGAAVWGVGFYFEAVGDWQMARFKAKPENKGKVLSSGVWRYTRHPNYFGDAAQWWGFWLIAVGTLSAAGLLSVFSPALMTFLLLRVSGVAMLEKSLRDAKPQYKEYIETTSAFFPCPPRKSRQ
ncbi:MAG: DUF1295 domain-containing protein [Anaerolineae bacterium]|nr:DUF1295 domain-containing protein [Anaerolineae bacterium]